MYKKRIEKLRENMSAKGIESFLVISDPNRNYLSGFTGNESFALITKEEAFFITDSRYTEQAEMQVKDYQILQYKGKIIDFISDLVNSKGIKNIALEEGIVTLSFYQELKGKYTGEILSGQKEIEDIRIIKSKDEAEKIKKAASIADSGFSHMLNFIKEGMTEREIALELEFFMKKQGASGLSFETIAASGFRSSLPHGAASGKKIEKGEFLTLDFGCIYQDYCSDMTRTVAIGEVSPKMKDIYNIVLEANRKALKAIKPGAVCKDVDAVARGYIEAMGYGANFGHGLGHGVGREIHEAPRLSPMCDVILKSGMVVTDEPGIYLPGEFGVRIEDLVLVTDEGFEVLSKSPRELISL